MTSHHIICDITGTVFMSSLPRYLTLHPQYLFPHNPSNCDLCTTVCMTSHQLYIWHLMHHTFRHIHSLSSHHYRNHITSNVFMTSHTLYRNSHIWQHKLYLPSHPLYLTLHPLYLCHQTPCISCITPTLCMTLHTKRLTSLSVCMASHVHFLTSHPYRYDITSSIFMTSYEINMMSPIVFHENKMNIPDISPTVFDIIAPPSVRWHPLSQCLHNYYGSLHTWHTYDIIHTLHHIKFWLYESNRQYLGHHKHCIHDIRSPIYDITSTVYDISSPMPVT